MIPEIDVKHIPDFDTYSGIQVSQSTGIILKCIEKNERVF